MLNFQSIGLAFEYCWTFWNYFMKELKLSAVFDRFTFCIRIRFRSRFIPTNFFLRSKLCIGPRKVPESPGKDREKLGRPQLSGTKSKLVHWKWIYIKIYFVLNWVNQVFFAQAPRWEWKSGKRGGRIEVEKAKAWTRRLKLALEKAKNKARAHPSICLEKWLSYSMTGSAHKARFRLENSEATA